MRQLSQLEKRLLRIIALQQQMEATGAVGDFAKTINYTANQLKQLEETFKEIGRWVAQYFMFALQPVVEYILAFSIAIRELLKHLNEIKGYKYEDAGAGGFFGEQKSEIEAANEVLQEYKNNLLGFDDLNVLGENDTTSMEDIGFLTKAILKYESKLKNVSNRANELANTMLEWLGYTYDANGNLEKTGGTLSNILATTKLIIATLVGAKIWSLIATIPVTVDGVTVTLGHLLKVLGTSSSGFGILGTLGLIAGVLAILYSTNEDFRKSMDSLIISIGQVLKPIIETIATIVVSLMPIITSTLNTIAKILVPILETIAPLISSFASVFEYIMSVVSWLGTYIANELVNGIEGILSLLEIIGSVIELIVGFVGNGLKGAFESVSTIVAGMKNAWDSLTKGDFKGFIKAFDEMGKELKKIWNNVWESIKGVFANVINGIIQGFASFVNMFSKAINSVTSTLSNVWTWLGIPAIPEIPEWNPSPIELATGGVITQPTHALIGEYKGASSNPEIVTPENLMREVFMESMLPIAQAIVNGDSRVVEAIQNLADRPIELNGRKVSENIYSDLEDVAFRKGKTLSFG